MTGAIQMHTEEEVIVAPSKNLPYNIQQQQRNADNDKYAGEFVQEQINAVFKIFDLMEKAYNAKEVYEPNFRKTKVSIKAYDIISSKEELVKELQDYAESVGFKKVVRLKGEKLSICYESKRAK
jgi:hypothetical protein